VLFQYVHYRNVSYQAPNILAYTSNITDLKALHRHATSQSFRRIIQNTKPIPDEEEIRRVHLVRRTQLLERLAIRTPAERSQMIGRRRNVGIETEPDIRAVLRQRGVGFDRASADGVPARAELEVFPQADGAVFDGNEGHVIAEEREAGVVACCHGGDV
jgi:hypothetical protein